MKVALGNDHRGYQAKEIIRDVIRQLGHEVIDCGTDNPGACDYPDFAYLAAKEVSEQRADRGILVCATGIGMSMAANKIKGVRAALCHDELSAQISRDHNDSNVLCLPGDQVSAMMLGKIVETWLNTPFSGGRHLRRVQKIAEIEQGHDPRGVSQS
ncbi:MAG TPA: ribose 5-phosphate isomerase B [Phycisphaerales bacterium]|nr:ribose 5-phosphate isomerase B [Phycisphaerales bacterium]